MVWLAEIKAQLRTTLLSSALVLRDTVTALKQSPVSALPCPSIATRLANDSCSKNGFKQKFNYRFVHRGHYLLAFSTSEAT